MISERITHKKDSLRNISSKVGGVSIETNFENSLITMMKYNNYSYFSLRSQGQSCCRKTRSKRS